MLVRTTLRIEKNLKKNADRKALQDDVTFQELFNRALEDYLKKDAKKKAKKIVFKSYNLGKALDNLTRNDYYDDPQT